MANKYDYVFSENGMVGYKDGKFFHQNVRINPSQTDGEPASKNVGRQAGMPI